VILEIETKAKMTNGKKYNDKHKQDYLEENKMNHLKGIHHVTAITSSAEKNYEFFTYVLGIRLVKKL